MRRIDDLSKELREIEACDKAVFAAFVGILLIISATMYKLTKPKGGKGFDSGRFKLCITAVAGILMIAIFIALCVKSI